MLISCIYLTLGFSGNIGILIVTNILDCHLNLKIFVKVFMNCVIFSILGMFAAIQMTT